MGTLEQKLSLALQSKESIKAILIEKGVINENTPFKEYASAIESLSAGGSEEDFTTLLLTGSATSFEIPSNITSLAPYRFASFTNLKVINFKKVKTIPKYTCSECSNLETVTFADGTTEIGDYAFNNCKKMKSILIPKTVTKVGSYGFYYAGNSNGSSNAFEVVFDSPCDVGSSAFYYTYLSKIEGKFSKISNQAFRGSSSYNTLKTVNIETCNYLDSYCFQDNYYVENFYLNPESIITYLGSYVFQYFGCRRTNDEYFTFDFQKSTFTQVYDYAFAGSSSYKNKNMRVFLPSTVGTISGYAFAYNDNLELYLNSIPTLSSTTAFQTCSNLKIFATLDDVGTIKSKTNWVTYASSINGYGRGITYGVGNKLPLYTDVGGYAITWFEDKDFTIPVTSYDITEENVNNNFFAQVGSTREVGWVRTPLLLDATMTITDGTNTYKIGDSIPINTVVTITVEPSGTTKTQLYNFTINGVQYSNGISITVTEDISVFAVYYDGVNLPILPTLSDNSIALIAEGCRLGINRSMWTVGDTFKITLTNGDIVTARYCDDTPGRYTYADGSGQTNAVFEIVELIRKDSSTTTFQFNPSSNTDSDGAYNNWEVSQLRESMNSGDIWNLFPDDFKTAVKPVNIITAKNGTNSELITTADCLFLPAERELFSSKAYSRTEEWNALGSQFSLYATNNTNAFRKKYLYGTTSANRWWERSPYSGYASVVCSVGSSGGAGNNDARGTYGVAPCFAF